MVPQSSPMYAVLSSASYSELRDSRAQQCGGDFTANNLPSNELENRQIQQGLHFGIVSLPCLRLAQTAAFLNVVFS